MFLWCWLTESVPDFTTRAILNFRINNAWIKRIQGPVSISDKTSYRLISERSNNSKYKSLGFETSRDLMITRLIEFWNGAQIAVFGQSMPMAPTAKSLVPFGGLIYYITDTTRIYWNWYETTHQKPPTRKRNWSTCCVCSDGFGCLDGLICKWRSMFIYTFVNYIMNPACKKDTSLH